MPITYTNRRGVTYYLCQGLTKTGKKRYWMARRPSGEPVEAMPVGYQVSEDVNGLVSIGKPRPSQIRPEELAAVEAVLRKHPRAGDYRVVDKRDRIEVFERQGEDAKSLLELFGDRYFGMRDAKTVIEESLERHAYFSAVLRFILIDPAQRTFQADRWCYLGSIDDWIPLSSQKPLFGLVGQLIPLLGTQQLIPLLGTQQLFDLTYFSLG